MRISGPDRFCELFSAGTNGTHLATTSRTGGMRKAPKRGRESFLFFDKIDRIFRIILIRKNHFQSLFRATFGVKRNSFIFITNGPLNLPI